MDFPITAFEIKGTHDEYIRLEIAEIYGFPDDTSFRGGYDINCNLEISVGNYRIKTTEYISSTGALYKFYEALNKCYKALRGKCTYDVYFDENYLTFDVVFDKGNVSVTGSYQDDPHIKNILHFEFCSDQSYFVSVLNDLKKVINIFGDTKGKRNSV